MQIARRREQPLSELRKVLKKFPQAQRNLKIAAKPPLDSLVESQRLIAETEAQLGDAGRVLVRYSGTENLVRILIEGRDAEYIEAQADLIAESLLNEIEGSI